MTAFTEEQARVLQALRSVGVEASSVDDLVNDRVRYGKEAIRILADLLPSLKDDRLQESVVRSLGVRAARGIATQPLLTAFRSVRLDDKAREGSLQWAIGNALSVVADESIIPDLILLIRDRRYGIARQMLLAALGRSKSPQVVDCLIDALEEEELTGHALQALAKLRPARARASVERFTSHPTPWIRRAAERAVASINATVE
jgi:HEAT repeat protein